MGGPQGMGLALKGREVLNTPSGRGVRLERSRGAEPVRLELSSSCLALEGDQQIRPAQ